MFFTVSSSLPAPRLAAVSPRLSFMLAFKLSKNSCKLPSFSSPSSVRLRVQKYYIFLYLQQLFSLFFKLFPFALNVSKINFTFFAIIAAARRFSGGKRGFRGLPRGRILPFSARFGALPARFWRKSARVSRLPRRSKAVRAGPSTELHLIYICVWTGLLADVPGGALPRTPAAHMVAEVASYRRLDIMM